MECLFAEDSPFRKPPGFLTRKQLLVVDGLRYSAEMAHVAYQRLRSTLQEISAGHFTPSSAHAVEALQDAWSIVDSANRFRDLLGNFPGLKQDSWTKVFRERTVDVDELRNCVQHPVGELENLAMGGGQVWGYLSWAELLQGKPTGHWFGLCYGSHFAGDQWFIAGPATLPFRVANDRIRLTAYGREVYLWRIVAAMVVAARKVEEQLQAGKVQARGPAATGYTGSDYLFRATITVVVEDTSLPKIV